MNGQGEDDRADRGLRRYLQLVAHALGADPNMCWYEWQPEPAAFLALEQRIPGRSAGKLALVWDERMGWSAGIDTDDDFIVLASINHDVLPSPRVVAAFVTDLVAGDLRPSADPAAPTPGHAAHEARQRLATYAPPASDIETVGAPPRRL